MISIPRQRYEKFDGLRGFASLAVVIHHSVLFYDYALFSGRPDQSHTTWDLAVSAAPLTPAGWGNLAVCIFFVLSGFVLAHSFERTKLNWPAIMVKRYLRLTLPIIVACLLAGLILLSGLGFYHRFVKLVPLSMLAGTVIESPRLAGAVREGLTAVFKAQSHLASYDGVLWTMPIEFAGSCLLATIYVVARWRGWSRVGKARALAAMLILLTLVFLNTYLTLFGVGALIYTGRTKTADIVSGSRLIWLMLACGLLIGTLPDSIQRWSGFNIFQSLYPYIWAPRWSLDWLSFWHGVGGILIVVAVLSSGALTGVLSSAVSQWLGRISFPLYLVHMPLAPIVFCGAFVVARDHGWPDEAAAVAAIFSLVAASLVLADVTTRLVEGPAIRMSGMIGGWIDARLTAKRSRAF